MTERTLELDAASLKAVAHPLRMEMLRVLQRRKQASVTSLAEELGETTGATSYHLRQLARHGFVEQFTPDSLPPPADGKRATGRPQKWWREAVDQIHMSGLDLLADPDTREAARFVLRDIEADRSRRLANWYATGPEWSEQWQHASGDGDHVIELDPKQARALADELKAVVEKYTSRKPGRGARQVDVQWAVFPTDDGTRA